MKELKQIRSAPIGKGWRKVLSHREVDGIDEWTIHSEDVHGDKTYFHYFSDYSLALKCFEDMEAA